MVFSSLPITPLACACLSAAEHKWQAVDVLLQAGAARSVFVRWGGSNPNNPKLWCTLPHSKQLQSEKFHDPVTPSERYPSAETLRALDDKLSQYIEESLRMKQAASNARDSQAAEPFLAGDFVFVTGASKPEPVVDFSESHLDRLIEACIPAFVSLLCLV